MSDYTPTTDEVRQLWIVGQGEFDIPCPSPEQSAAEFDRWLAAHDAEARRQALLDAVTVCTTIRDANAITRLIVADDSNTINPWKPTPKEGKR